MRGNQVSLLGLAVPGDHSPPTGRCSALVFKGTSTSRRVRLWRFPLSLEYVMPVSGNGRQRRSWWSRRTGAQQVAIISAAIGALGAIVAAVVVSLLQGATTINVFTGPSSRVPSA